MSLSKTLSELKINNQIKRRDSFSDRVCDDLSEVILNFLPLKDKFRFECVSKQFQRTIYQRHHHLTLTYFMRLRLETVETLLKKLLNIKSLQSSVLNRKLFNERYLKKSEFDLITKYSNHLNELEVNLIVISKRFGKEFLDKFGPQLTTISIYPLNDKLIIKSLINIQKIAFESINSFKAIHEYYSQIESKDLKELQITVKLMPSQILPENDIKCLDKIIEFNKNITHLWIQFRSTFVTDLNLSNISKLNQLISLKIEANIELKSFGSDLKLLANNCLKLKSLSLTLNVITEDMLKNNDFMSEIKRFKELKRFMLTLSQYSGNFIQFEDYIRNSLKTGFEDLTHLTIDFIYYQLNESLLEVIVNNLPKLQYLKIINKIKVTEKTAEIVNRLSKLQVLELDIVDKSLSNLLINKITEKCRKIKSISFASNPFYY